MLGKIFTLCMLMVVSACLVRPQTASKPNLAGVAGKVAEDVSILLGKLGAKSTDEAVAKLLAKGDELSDADQRLLRKLLNGSDGAAALAALQRPVTSKLAKLDNMLAEYKLNLAPEKLRKSMLAEIDKTVDDINVAADRYMKIRHLIWHSHVTLVEYSPRQVLEMAKIEGLARVKYF